MPANSYQPRVFTLPAIPGISSKQIAEHLKLYEGYVKRTNALYEAFERLSGDPDPVVVQDLRRRLGFEFNGMRLHEFYFGDLEGGPQPLPEGWLKESLAREFGDTQGLRDALKVVVARGSGWAIANYDPLVHRIHLNWVDEHHIGQLATLPIIAAVDMWEHAYMVDYTPGEKMRYFDAYWAALNWETIARRAESWRKA
ncbi:superoxide dismutase [Candidatus Parcubacteria bacterium]|jgi:Fe-Mn family superoxide dismutase|nr:MAG: superoxide dismutase [Candidatus Parcubacteria bacterium]GIW68812.1 MAG: superoxide dismutase [Candidatus Parcubacteria bacterium]